MSTFIVPEIGTNFSNARFDGLLLQYLYDEWSITTPTDIAKPATFPSSDKFDFRTGFFGFDRPYELTVLYMETIPVQILSRNRLLLNTIMTVNLRMQRLDRDGGGIDPELSLMEEEVFRIVMQYNKAPQDVAGIKDMLWQGVRRDYALTDEWSESDWRSIVTVNLQHEKVSTV